jgi:O-antigen ligase
MRIFKKPSTPLYKDPYRLVLLVLVLQTITQIALYIGLASVRPGLVLFSLSVLFALTNPRNSIDPSAFQHFVPKLIIGQALLVCASAAFGISLGHSATFIINTYWKTVVFALLLISSFRGVDDVRRLVWTIVLSGVLLAFLAIFVVHLSKSQGMQVWDANDVGLIMVTCLPLGLLLIQTTKSVTRLVPLLGAMLIAITIAKSNSRGAFLGALAVGIALLLFLPGVSIIKRLTAIGGVIVAMVMYAPSDYWDNMKTLQNPTADYNYYAPTGRRQLAKRGFGYMRDYPLFGIGVDNFEMAEGTISPLAKELADSHIGLKWGPSHNSWVQAAAETGVPGLLVFAGLILGSAVSLLRLRRGMQRSWLKGTPEQRFLYLATLYVPIAFLGFAVSSTFVTWAFNDLSFLLPAIALGLHKAYHQVKVAPPSAEPAVRRGHGNRLRLRPATV